jgi:hypothetical protein
MVAESHRKSDYRFREKLIPKETLREYWRNFRVEIRQHPAGE